MNLRQQDQHYIIPEWNRNRKAIAYVWLQRAKNGYSSSESKLQAVVSEIQHQGGVAQYRTYDIELQSEVEQVISEAVESFGPLVVQIGLVVPIFLDPMIDLTQSSKQLEWDLLHPRSTQAICTRWFTDTYIVTSSCLARFGAWYTALRQSWLARNGSNVALELAKTLKSMHCVKLDDTDMAWEGLEGMAKGMKISVEQALKCTNPYLLGECLSQLR